MGNSFEAIRATPSSFFLLLLGDNCTPLRARMIDETVIHCATLVLEFIISGLEILL